MHSTYNPWSSLAYLYKYIRLVCCKCSHCFY